MTVTQEQIDAFREYEEYYSRDGVDATRAQQNLSVSELKEYGEYLQKKQTRSAYFSHNLRTEQILKGFK